MDSLRIRKAEVRRASESDQRQGVLGFVTLDLHSGLRLEGLVVRRSAGGRVYVSYPAKPGRDGRREYLFRPVDEEARRRLEREILDQLKLEGEDAR